MNICVFCVSSWTFSLSFHAYTSAKYIYYLYVWDTIIIIILTALQLNCNPQELNFIIMFFVYTNCNIIMRKIVHVDFFYLCVITLLYRLKLVFSFINMAGACTEQDKIVVAYYKIVLHVEWLFLYSRPWFAFISQDRQNCPSSFITLCHLCCDSKAVQEFQSFVVHLYNEDYCEDKYDN